MIAVPGAALATGAFTLGEGVPVAVAGEEVSAHLHGRVRPLALRVPRPAARVAPVEPHPCLFASLRQIDRWCADFEQPDDRDRRHNSCGDGTPAEVDVGRALQSAQLGRVTCFDGHPSWYGFGAGPEAPVAPWPSAEQLFACHGPRTGGARRGLQFQGHPGLRRGARGPPWTTSGYPLASLIVRAGRFAGWVPPRWR